MHLPLDVAARYLHWGWIQISPANLAIIALMVVAFVAAILLTLPDHSEGDGRHDDEQKR